MPVTRKALPTRTTTPTPGKVVGGEPDKGPAPAGAASSFAGLFDKTKAAAGGVDVPPGDYEAVLVYAKVEEPNDKGTAVLLKYNIADEGDHQGKVISSYYGVMTPEGTEGKGMGYFKRDLAKLGFPDIAGDDVEDALGQLEDAKDGVSIKVKVKDGYTNVYLDGIVESSDIINKWKAEMPETPY